MKTRIIRILSRALGWFGILLLFASLVFEAFPLMPNNTLNTFHLAARQRVLAEHIVKDIFILAYRSSPDDQAEAISEIQTALPVWEQVQTGLQNGDTSLGISPNLPGDMKLMLLQVQPDYAYLDAAARRILARPSPVDPTQLSIVLQHDQPYYISMGQTVNIFQDDINNTARVYFEIELGIGIFLMIIWISFLIATNKALKNGNDMK